MPLRCVRFPLLPFVCTHVCVEGSALLVRSVHYYGWSEAFALSLSITPLVLGCVGSYLRTVEVSSSPELFAFSLLLPLRLNLKPRTLWLAACKSWEKVLYLTNFVCSSLWLAAVVFLEGTRGNVSSFLPPCHAALTWESYRLLSPSLNV